MRVAGVGYSRAGPDLSSGPHWWDAEAIWAPDVVFDEAVGHWAMLYTGVSEGMVQRACLAWSADLENWVKDPHNPVFEPDSTTCMWSPSEACSSFRDPFLYREDGRRHMLNTAGARLGGYPGHKQAIVHRAVSDDLVNWSDGGIFFAHDGVTGRHHDFESVQYIRMGPYHHLFFVEQDPDLETHSTSLNSGLHPADWTMADREIIDEGWAPEIKVAGQGNARALFARLHQYDDPSTGLTHVVVRFDPLTFRHGGGLPVVDRANFLGDRWPHRSGQVGAAAPTFRDNPALRGEPSAGLDGHGWFSSYEYCGGPLNGVGQPGQLMGENATGSLVSEEFQIGADFLRFKVAGGHYPETCYFALLDALTDQVIFSATGGGSVHTNPFNPITTVSFSLADSQQVVIEVFDVAGRRVRQLTAGFFSAGNHQVRWDGRDGTGQDLPSGIYFIRLTDGDRQQNHKVTLTR